MSGSAKDLKGGASSTKKKVTLYFNAPMLAETQKEAIRQDRSISWIIQAAWRRARDEIRKLPTVGRLGASDASDAEPETETATPPRASETD
ncbi:MAG: TIGR04563 family protein [Pseudomonadota bacterium]